MNYGAGGLNPLPQWASMYADSPPGVAPHPQRMYHMAAAPPGYYPQGPAAWGLPQQQSNFHMIHVQQQVHALTGANAMMAIGPAGGGPRYPAPIPASQAPPGEPIPQESKREEQPERSAGGAGFALRRGAEANRNSGEMVKTAEKAARQAYDELVREEKHISVTKVVQSTLSALGVSSFELLGFRMQDVPCLRNLALVEGKVNASIQSHIAAKRITTLYDLGCELTQEEGVSDFEELGIGPLLRHPLVVRYFSPPDEVLSITAEEVLQHLAAFMGEPEQRKHVEIDEFMGYLQSKQKAPTRLHLGVRIQSLGLHVGAVMRAKKAELEYVKNWEALARSQLSTKSSVVSRVTDFLSSQKLRSKALDDNLKRKRNHIYFASDDEDEESRPSKKSPGQEAAPKMAMIKEVIEQLADVSRREQVGEASSQVEIVTGPRSCPYPSAAEERLRAKRLTQLRAKRQTQLQAELDSERRELCLLSWPEVMDFVTTLKDACAHRTILQVLEHLVDAPWPKNDVNMKRKRVLSVFKSNPGIGLLYVAVTSVRMGLWDSPYDVLQDMQQQHKQRSAVQTVAMAGPVTIDRKPSAQSGPKAANSNAKASETNAEAIPESSNPKTEPVSESKPSQTPRVPLHRVQAFIAQAMQASKAAGGSAGSCTDLAHRICKHFDEECVDDLGLGSLESLVKDCGESGGKTAASSTSVFFLGALAGEGHMTPDPKLSPLDSFPDSTAKVGVLGLKTTADAAQALKNAPVLADLRLWSQWDAVFAPSLGPLLGWLERDGAACGVHTLVTDAGAILKVDASVTVDGFLPAVIGGDSAAVAAQLVSIVVAYGGVDHAPAALLKTYAAKAVGVLLGSVGSATRGQGDDRGAVNPAPVAVFLLKVLCAAPSELRVFAAQILLPAFSSAVQYSASVLLGACQSLKDRLALHGLGLALGVGEWVQDFTSLVLAVPPTKYIETVAGSSGDGTHKEQASEEKPSNSGRTTPVDSSGEVEPVPSNWSTGPTADDEHENQADARTETDDMNLDQSMEGTGATDGFTGMILGDLAGTAPAAGEDGQREKAQAIVEAIRRDEFGVGRELGNQEQDLLARQHARMGRALHRLSQDLYSQDSHFVLELVQNADDNAYGAGVEAALVFVVQPGHIVVFNNEEGFTPANLRALCDVGNSTKAGSSTGYIGHKGIGFKSVFRVTDAPEIHSEGFDVKFDITESNLGFILPTIIPRPPRQDAESYCDILGSVAESGGPNRRPVSWNTRIDLPIKASIREGPGMDALAGKFDDIHPSLLLFLHRLRCIAVRNDVAGATKRMRREDLSNGLVRVVHDKGHATWLVVRHQVPAAVRRPGITGTEIALAFTLRELAGGQYEASPEQQQVFAFLPLRSYGLRFIVQGDFILPSSREEVDRDSAWNQWLRSEIPEAFLKAAEMFKALPFLASRGRAVSNYLRFVPLEGEVLGFFASLPRLIHARLQATPCLPVDGIDGGWSFPCALLRAWDGSARKLMPDALLKEHLGFQYLDEEVELSDPLATSLGVQKYGSQTLVAFMTAICQKDEGAASMGLEWVRDWLVALHDCLLAERQLAHFPAHQEREPRLARELQGLRFVPLADGSCTALADGPVWFAGQPAADRIGGGSGGVDKPPTCFPLLYAELRTVHPALFHSAAALDEGDAVVDPKNSGNVVTMLHQLGVRPMSAHHVLRSHVLPAMADPGCTARGAPLLVQYLGYAKWHLESGCTQCAGDRVEIVAELRRNAMILTNNGLVRVGGGGGDQEAPLHFGPAMGNPFDARGVLDGTAVKWNEVDKGYLELEVPEPGGLSVASWRKFLGELGVTDFVRVSPVERIVKDKAASAWKDEDWEGEAAPPAGGGGGGGGWVLQDWESPELVELIGAVCGVGTARKPEQKGKKGLKKVKRCALILSTLDKLWASDYASSWRAVYRPAADAKDARQGLTPASWVLQVRNLKWVKSSVDKQLHAPTALFQRCDTVSSILGAHATYVCTQIQSAELTTALGLRTKVTVDDCLALLQHWGPSDQVFEASVAQMARLYLFLAERMPQGGEQVLATFKSQPAIFLPWSAGEAREEVLEGSFLSLEEVCWSDPTGALAAMLAMGKPSCKKKPAAAAAQGSRQRGAIKALSVFYPELQTFFVERCRVPERPDFYGYVGILERLAAVTPPSAVLDQVMEILAAWSWDVECGKVTKAELQQWKARLQQADCAVLPTTHDKWVSLNAKMGLVCVCDDEKIGKEFPEDSENLHFLRSDEPSKVAPDKRGGRSVQQFYAALGIPFLSQVVRREVIMYGSQDAAHIEKLVIWALPYAQRYIRQHHMDVYTALESERIRKQLKGLRYVVADRLFFQYSLQSGQIRSRGRIECGCVLEGKTLHIAAARSEDHCMVYTELARLFFTGRPNQQFANFLHLITMMASLGSPESDVEAYIAGTQGVPPLPAGVAPWRVKPSPARDGNRATEEEPGFPSDGTGPSQAEVYLQRHAKLEKGLPRKAVAQPYSGWPPRSWVPLPTVQSTAMSSVQIDEYAGPSAATGTKREPAKQKVAEEAGASDGAFSVPTGVPWNADGTGAGAVTGGPGHFKSEGSGFGTPFPVPLLKDALPSTDMPERGAAQTSARDQLGMNAAATAQQQMTGRAGEEVAYQYLVKKHGAQRVRWVNEDGETGAAFDMVVERGGEGEHEFVEVKTTRSPDKDWFEVSAREWEFAHAHGDRYTVLRVTLPAAADESFQIIRFANPVKLCRERVLQLAVILPFSGARPSPQGIQFATYKVTLPNTDD